MKTLLFPLLLFFVACSGQTRQANNYYYFTLKSFINEKTYCFVNQNDTSENSNWKLKTIVYNKDTLLQTSIFDSKNRITEIMTEKIVNRISKIQNYTLFNYDQQENKHSADCRILDSLVYNEGQKINNEIRWKVNFKDFNSSNTCELTKIRILKNNNENQSTFTDLMRFEVLETGQGYQYHMTSVYEKNKGLIAYKLMLPGGITKDYKLKNIK